MKDPRKAEEIAAQRVQVLAPLFQEGLDAAQQRQLRQQIMQQTGLSNVRCAGIWHSIVQRDTRALSPRHESRNLRLPQFRKKYCSKPFCSGVLVPGRSVSTIIDILEMEQLALPANQTDHPAGTPGGERLQCPPHEDVPVIRYGGTPVPAPKQEQPLACGYQIWSFSAHWPQW